MVVPAMVVRLWKNSVHYGGESRVNVDESEDLL